MTPEPDSWTIAGLGAAYRAGSLSPVEATEEFFRRIEAHDGHLRAFITTDPAGALAAARASEARLRRGAPIGPLDGIPLAYKDLCFLRGMPSTCGSRIYADLAPPEECTAAVRLRAAGAVTLGKLNMAELALGPTGHNMHYGDVQNPWKAGHISGGSSSGSAAAVAAGLAAGAVGSDTGGSVRVPSAFCGLVGLKPTWGRVSRHGAMPLSWSLDCLGPMTRTAAGNARMLRVMAGRDPEDPTSSRLPVPDYAGAATAGAGGLRLGIAEDFFEGVSGEVAAAVREAARLLERLGAALAPVSLPAPEELERAGNVLLKCEAVAVHGEAVRARAAEVTPQVLARMEAGFHIGAADYLQAQRLRARLAERYAEEVFSRADAVIAPAVPCPAPTHAETGVGAGEAMPALIRDLTRLTRPISALGAPAMSVPCGFSAGGLPLAFQLIGAPYREEVLYRLAGAYERETGWWERRPAL